VFTCQALDPDDPTLEPRIRKAGFHVAAATSSLIRGFAFLTFVGRWLVGPTHRRHDAMPELNRFFGII
jgi:hypothetical protein